MQIRSFLAAAGAVALAACADVPPTAPIASSLSPNLSQAEQSVGGVFVSTNGIDGNAVVAYARAANGTLTSTGTFATGGTSTGGVATGGVATGGVATGGVGIGGVADPLVSQFALALSDNAKLLVVVNAGSNDVSSFAVDGGQLFQAFALEHLQLPALYAQPAFFLEPAQHTARRLV